MPKEKESLSIKKLPKERVLLKISKVKEKGNPYLLEIPKEKVPI
jgi:hypothetical protein